MLRRLLIGGSGLLSLAVLYWFFIHGMPSEQMMRLLGGDDGVAVEKLTARTVHGTAIATVDDPEGLAYLSAALRKAKKEGHVPEPRPKKEHSAIVWLGTFAVAKIGLYADPGSRGLTVYYPYHEDAPIDIEYYWVALDGPLPDSIRRLYEQLRAADDWNKPKTP